MDENNEFESGPIGHLCDFALEKDSKALALCAARPHIGAVR
jgi:hypothetical protein